MVTDTHCHLDMKEFDADRDEVIKKALASGISKMITVGVDVESSKKAVGLSQKYPEVYAAVGVQPEEVGKYVDDELRLKSDFRQDLEELTKNGKVVAIGEIGLDYLWLKKKSSCQEDLFREREKQKEIFRRQLGLAVTLDLPVIIHVREAEEDILTEIQRYKETKKLGGVIHCFTGTLDFAKKVLDLGFYISFSGIMTFPSAKDLREVVKEVPLDRILVETDSPLIAPQSHRGERNEPSYTLEIIKTIGQIRNLPPENVSGITTKNAGTLFNLE